MRITTVILSFFVGCHTNMSDDPDAGMNVNLDTFCTPWNHQYTLQWDCSSSDCPTEYTTLQFDLSSAGAPNVTGITVLTDGAHAIYGSMVVDYDTDCALSGFVDLYGAYLRTCLVTDGVAGDLRYGPDEIVGTFIGESAGVFDVGDTPPPFVCGGDHEPCCLSADDGMDICLCHPGNELVSSTCFACGLAGQPCCTGLCDADSTCVLDSGLCVTCGGLGQPCCEGRCDIGACNLGICSYVE